VNRTKRQHASGKSPSEGVSNEKRGAIERKKTPSTRTAKEAVSEERLDELMMRIDDLAGVKSSEVASGIVYQVGAALVHPKPADDTQTLIKALEAIREMAPKGPEQSMLAAQMIATNEASARFLAVSFEPGHTLESRTSNVNRAVRLMQLYLLQLEAFEKLRGRAVQQKVVVEHVHVHAGGQAIVGAVTASKLGEGVGDLAQDGGNTP
jgi:hypothetical protein